MRPEEELSGSSVVVPSVPAGPFVPGGFVAGGLVATGPATVVSAAGSTVVDASPRAEISSMSCTCLTS